MGKDLLREYGKAKPNRFAAQYKAERVAVVLDDVKLSKSEAPGALFRTTRKKAK
jgi:hypothetical protein